MSASPILGLHAHNFASGTEQLIAVWKNGAVHRSTGGWFNGPGIALTSGLEAYMSSFLDRVVLTNGTDRNWSYDGSVWSQNDIMKGSPIATFNQSFPSGAREFLFNIKINGNAYLTRAWFSDLPSDKKLTWGFQQGTDLVQTADSNVVTSVSAGFKTNNIKVGDPFFITTGVNLGKYIVQALGDTNGDNKDTTIQLTENLVSSATGSSYYTGSNFIDIGTGDGDEGKGMGVTSNEIYFFLKNSAHRYNVNGNTLRQLENAVGTTSSRSIVSEGGFVYWYHPTGIYRAAGDTVQYISDPIYDIISGVDEDSQEDVVGWANEDLNTINMYLNDVTTREGDVINDCVAVFDLDSETWTLRSLNKVFRVATPWLHDSNYEVYAGDNESTVYRMDFGNDFDGDEIPFQLETKVIFPYDPETVSDLFRLSAFVEDGPNVTLGFMLFYKPDGKDNKGSWIHDTEWTPMKGSQNGQRADWVFPTGSRAAGVKIRVLESSADTTFRLERLVLYCGNPANY